MSWIPPVTKNVVKYGVKYGPQAKVVWDAVGDRATVAVKAQAENVAASRKAFAEAETVVDGRVLRLVRDGRPVWVVYSGGQPQSAYPPPSVELAELVANADLSQLQTPQEHRDAQLRARAGRATKKAAQVSAQAARTGRQIARSPKRRQSP